MTGSGRLTTYDRSWQGELEASSTPSARRIVPLVTELVRPRSVVDLGCGSGVWLAAFREQGVEDVLGIDGPWVDRARLRIPPDRFQTGDLAVAVQIERTFDLALCLEVAEHLPPEAAPILVGSLTALAPVVLFSAAIPGQGGRGHLNERWPDYWAGLFRARGFVTLDCIRPVIWDEPEVCFWYAQNSLLMVREGWLDRFAGRLPDLPADPRMLRVVHPRLWEARERYHNAGLVRKALRRALRVPVLSWARPAAGFLAGLRS